jgi:Flp pilus assembly protein TadG
VVRSARGHDGQATIETVVLLPVLLAVLLGAWQLVLAGWTLVACESAARAGARASLTRSPVTAAALADLPGPMRADAAVTVAGGRVVVRVRVPSVIPGFRPSVTSSAALVTQ